MTYEATISLKSGHTLTFHVDQAGLDGLRDGFRRNRLSGERIVFCAHDGTLTFDYADVSAISATRTRGQQRRRRREDVPSRFYGD